MHKAVWIVLVAVALAPLAAGGVDENRQEYMARAAEVPSADVLGHYQLGLWCRTRGLEEEARLQFERVVALSPDHEGARRELGYERHEGCWLSAEEALRAKGLVRYEGTWLLPEEVAILTMPATEKARLEEGKRQTRKILRTMVQGGPRVQRVAMQALRAVDDKAKVDPLAYALRYPEESVRIFAANELMRIGDRRALRPLVHRSLVDPVPAVRTAALTAAKSFGDPNLLSPYAQAMMSENEGVRINAARAVGELGEIIGVQYLIYRWQAHGGGLVRSHIYSANQLSFIQDFDVEVAQTAFIADPIVGILQEGQVLDVRVIGTEQSGWLVERKVIRSSLKRLTGVDLGDKPGAWAAWWSENKERLVGKG